MLENHPLLISSLNLTPEFVAISTNTTTTTFPVSHSRSLHIFLYFIDHVIRNSQIFDDTSSNVALGHFPESVTILGIVLKMDGTLLLKYK